ncbi:MAG: SGNH/GDSL hydrolase family protein, partial [Rhodothermaceae bacterium]|nr:SGNH/GDSL hydrolase family protein [Rhodothermaceae bacterium]
MPTPLKTSKIALHNGGIGAVVVLVIFCVQCGSNPPGPLQSINEGDHIVLIGNNLCSRMMNFGHFETELHQRFPEYKLTIRNMCDGGNTPGFRPHPGRVSPWAFPGADSFYTELAQPSNSQGHFETPDEWLTRLQADVIVAFFGFNESYAGLEGVDAFESELEAFVQHTLSQAYNGEGAPGLALVSPIGFEDLTHVLDVPDGKQENVNLAAYSEAIQRVSQRHGLPFADVFSASRRWYRRTTGPLTIDGSQLNEEGYVLLAESLTDQLFGGSQVLDDQERAHLLAAVRDKNWHWHNDFKIPNGVHVYGRRYN